MEDRAAPTAAGGPPTPTGGPLARLVFPWQRLFDGLTSSLMGLSIITYTSLLLHAGSFDPTYAAAATTVCVSPPSRLVWSGQQGALVYSTS